MTETAAFDQLVGARRLLVFVGPGGVGKTTLAAATAVRAAEAGRRVAVITIDPAKRLADALGLDGLDDALREVRVGAGRLDAAMLDTRKSYDSLIERVAPDPEAKRRIFDNRVYQSFSRTLARSHAYVAMERLHDLIVQDEHDLIVLDTPPTRSALDILDAPGRLSRFLDERVLRAFVPADTRGATAWLRAKGTEAALRLFGAMAGDALMRELAGFFEVFLHLRDGFSSRAAAVQEALRADDTSFLLVTAPEITHLADAAYLQGGLLERGVPVDALLFNRSYHPDEHGAPITEGAPFDVDEALASLWADAPADAREMLSRAVDVFARQLAEDQRRRDAMRDFVARAPGPLVARFPHTQRGPTDLDGLQALAASAKVGTSAWT